MDQLLDFDLASLAGHQRALHASGQDHGVASSFRIDLSEEFAPAVLADRKAKPFKD